MQAPASTKGRAQVLTRHVGLCPWGQEGLRQGWLATVSPESVPRPGLAGGRGEGGGGGRAAGCCQQHSPGVGASPKAANPSCGD